jgi:NAD+ diphosphatase
MKNKKVALDRLTLYRGDIDTLRTGIGHRRHYGLYIRNGLIPTVTSTTSQLAWQEALADTFFSDAESVLLGADTECVYWAKEESATPSTDPNQSADYHHLRSLLPILDPLSAHLASLSIQLLHWQQHHRFCGRCGTATQNMKQGQFRRCSHKDCSFSIFPRLDPAIIVKVTREDRILLGRQSSWPEGRYSTLAGFVDAAETLEQAVIREVLEETGVAVTDPVYFGSQPWPFPSSLMLGFSATALGEAIHCSDAELEDARWFSAADIESARISLPSPYSISYALIHHWYVSHTGKPLSTPPLYSPHADAPAHAR